MEQLSIKWTGIRPLIMSNPQTVDVENPFSVESRRLTNEMKAARKKGDEDMLVGLAKEQKRNDFLSSAYFDCTESKFMLPDTVILACIKASATSMKKGKDIDRCVLMEETHAYVENVPKVQNLESAYENPLFQFQCPAKIPPKKGALFMKMRCYMPTGWTIRFTLTFEKGMIAEKTMREIVKNAGLMVGVGGWRPKFGRFTVEYL